MFEGAKLMRWCSVLAATSALLATGCTSQTNDESTSTAMSALGGSLSVTGTAPTSANDGTDIQYSLAYKNGTSLPTTATTVSFTTPAHTTFQSVSGSLVCTNPVVGQSGVVSCAVGTAGVLTAGGTGSFNVTVHIAAGTTGTIDATTYSIAALGVSAQAGAAMHTTVTAGIPAADLAVTVTPSATSAVWGQALGYSIVATNNGPNAVSGATVSDAFPSTYTNVAWSCTPSSGASCAASGTGNIADSSVSLPVNGKVTYTVTGNVASGSGSSTLSDTASVAVPATASDTITSNNSATASTTLSSPNGITCSTGAECASGVCSPLAHLCVPAGGCGLDSDCSSDKYCNTVTYQCVSKLANGTPIPAILGHLPSLVGLCANASVGSAVCVSAVCDPADNMCGYASGDGSCNASNAATVCRSGACSTNGTCMPMGTCNTDGDCSSSSYCNVTLHQCTTKVANGQPLPIDLLHGSPLMAGLCTPQAAAAACQSGVCDADNLCGYGNGDGSCSSTNASSVCRSGACDTDGKCGFANGDGACSSSNAASVCRSKVCSADGKCGYGLGDGPCLAINAGTVCRSGICATTGALAGKCELCASDLNCSDSAPACDPLTAACVACTAANVLGCSGATPVCDLLSSTCKRCNGDLGSGASLACGSVLAPTCTDGACGRCSKNDDCVGSHNGPICNALTGACGNTCTLDTDCAGGQWCNGGSCAAKIANGQPLPSAAPILSTCTPIIGSRVCESGVCDLDGKCGFANGDGLCSSSNGSTVCRSGQCDTKGLLGSLLNTCQECASDAGCAGKAGTPACNLATDRCVQCTADNTSACTGSTPICNTTLSLCAPCVGDYGSGLPTACSSAAAPYCALGGACGLCTTNADCVGHAGPICDTSTGACGTACSSDSDCLIGNYCNAASGSTGACVPKLANGTHLPSAPSELSSCNATTGSRVCASGVCDATDQKCGRANGSACTSLLDCRILSCWNGTCGLPITLPDLDGGVDAGNDSGADAGSDAGDDAGSDAGVSVTVGAEVGIQLTGVDPRKPGHSQPSTSGGDDAGASIGDAGSPSEPSASATDTGSVGGSCSASPTQSSSDGLASFAMIGFAAFFGMRRRSKKAA